MTQVGSIIGWPIVDRMLDRFGAITVTSCAYYLSALFVFAMWIPAKNFATIIAFCLLMGALMGTVFATIPSLNSKLYSIDSGVLFV